MNEGVQLKAFPPGDGEKGLEEGKKRVMRLKSSVPSVLGRERKREEQRGGGEKKENRGISRTKQQNGINF